MGNFFWAVMAILGLLAGVPVFVLVFLLFFWIVFGKNSSARKPVLAFDYGGVITKGDFFTGKFSVNPGMKELVSRLNKKYKTVVVTNDNALAFDHVSKHFSTDNLFAKKFISSNIGYLKPDKRFYQKVLAELNAKPEEVIYIDDKLEYAQEARKLGIKSIHFKSENELIGELKKYGVTA